MPIRSARTAWDGTINEGSGQVELTSSGLGTFEVSWPKRTADDGNDITSPEELLGAAHSACYSMALAGELGRKGATPHGMEIKADVSFGPDPAGGFKVTGILLTVRADVADIDDAGFAEAAQAAKVGCPISKALTGVDITLDAALES